MALFPLLQTIYSFYKSSTLQLVRSELAALAVPAASPASSSTFTNKICFRNGTHNGIGYVSYQSGTHTDGICFRSWTQRTLTGRICSHSVTLTGRKLFLGGTFTGRICSRSVTLTGRIFSRSVTLTGRICSHSMTLTSRICSCSVTLTGKICSHSVTLTYTFW